MRDLEQKDIQQKELVKELNQSNEESKQGIFETFEMIKGFQRCSLQKLIENGIKVYEKLALTFTNSIDHFNKFAFNETEEDIQKILLEKFASTDFFILSLEIDFFAP